MASNAAQKVRAPVFATAPWKIPAHAWWQILRRVYAATNDNNLSLLAAGVAFYAFLSFVPLLGAVVMTYGLIGDPEMVSRHMQSIVTVVPRDAAKLISDQLLAIVTTAKGEAGVGLLIALALAVYGAMRAATAVIQALNVVYRERESRGILSFYALSAGITAAAVLVVVTGVVTASIIGFLQTLLANWGTVTLFVLKALTWVAAGLLASLIFALIYRFGPNRHKARWQWLTAGSLSATIFWLLATLGLSAYIRYFGNYNETYGSLGAVVVLLLWLFLSALVILIGAQINAEAERQTLADTTIGDDMPPGERGAAVADLH